jgi:GH18 family chitinase
VPEPALVAGITHIAIAFMQSSVFNEANLSIFPFFTNVSEVRSKFADGTAIMVAIGGWGDTAGFSKAAQTDESRKLFAKNVKTMVDHTGADGENLPWQLTHS